MHPRSHRVLPSLGLALLLAAASPAAAATVGLDDVVALLKAGVGEPIILKEIGDAGPSFDLGVPEVLKLKAAGAGDHLIEALMASRHQAPGEAAAASGPGGERQPGYRIFRETAADGKEILHVTNLDAQGRRMGGELQETEVAPTSTGVTGSGYDPAGRTQSGSGGEYAVLGNAPPSPPVVVNVYPPEPSTPEDDEGGYGSPYMYRDPYASTYSGGILPGYFPAYGVFRSRGAFTPPGSGNHFRRSHGDDGRRSCSRLGPNYVPIGPAIGFDTYYRHTRAGFRR